jgi:hypothetical protein
LQAIELIELLVLPGLEIIIKSEFRFRDRCTHPDAVLYGRYFGGKQEIAGTNNGLDGF